MTGAKPTPDQKKQRKQLVDLCREKRKRLGLSSAKVSAMMGRPTSWLGSREAGLSIITPQDLQLLQDKLATYERNNPSGAPKKSKEEVVVKPADKKGNGPVIKKPLKDDKVKTKHKAKETAESNAVYAERRKSIRALREKIGISQTDASRNYINMFKPDRHPDLKNSKLLSTYWWRLEAENSDKPMPAQRFKEIMHSLSSYVHVNQVEVKENGDRIVSPPESLTTRLLIEQGAVHTLPDGRQFTQDAEGKFHKHVPETVPILESDSMLIQIKNGKLVVRDGKSISELEELCDTQRGRIEELEQEIADMKAGLLALMGKKA